jgi:hypothetical protein
MLTHTKKCKYMINEDNQKTQKKTETETALTLSMIKRQIAYFIIGLTLTLECKIEVYSRPKKIFANARPEVLLDKVVPK